MAAQPIACRYQLCNASFASDDDLMNHSQLAHPGNPLVCPVCGYKCATPATLARHRDKHDNSDKYKCFIRGCDEAYPRRESLGNHLLTAHEEKLKNAVKFYEPYGPYLTATNTGNGESSQQNNGE